MRGFGMEVKQQRKAVAVPEMVMGHAYFSWKLQSKFVDRAFTPLLGAP